ncbi:MAG: lipoate--protein ligase [Bacteroidales bacterium]|nr:lipoate--protein ligase [Bacteroidales bacterium]
MYVLISSITDPFFNIAAEEYLLKNSYEDVFLIYRNDPSIIVGKHQNTIKEINLSYTERNLLKVVRRNSGGGTVYHDLGNVNYTFITSSEEGKQVDFVRYTEPILKVLNTFKVPAIFSGKSDLTVDGKKISGNAAHVFKSKVLHHGTLLFNANLNNLQEALNVNLDKFSDKAVSSRRAQVANISEYLEQPISIEDFMDEIITRVTIDFDTNYERNFNSGEMRRIEDLVKNKYSTWQWNFGYSPKYTYTSKFKSISFSLEVSKGLIEQLSFSKGSEFDSDLEIAERILVSVPHFPGEIKNRLKEQLKSPVIAGLEIDKFVDYLF